MNSGDPPKNRLLHYLALDGYATRICGIQTTKDALNWKRFLGSLSLVLVILLFLTGAVMMFFYTPVPGIAYDSVDYAQFSLMWGDVMRGVHHYAWNMLLIVIGFHLLSTFFTGAYKAPGQLIWISGVLILSVVPVLIITGDLLPWDQKGYWTTQVRISIIQSIPIIGEFCLRLLQGGTRTGIVALTRFYTLHCVFLPVVIIALIAIHFHFIAHHGLADPLVPRNTTRQRIPLVPLIVNRWLMLFMATSIILSLISIYWPVPLDSPADPTDSAFVPKPEWWVLALNQLVTIFKGPLMPLGTVVIPGGLMALLIILPFLDRSPDRHPQRRIAIIGSGCLILLGLIGLSIMGYFAHFGSHQP
ncbi:MAG: cytochrome b N-terminal domain-containing protein [Desulfatirhabdiaceae bacterium]